MWANTAQDRQAMIRTLVIAALPAIAHRYASGVGVRVLGTMYGCDPNWLRDLMLKSGYPVRPLEEATAMRPTAPAPWEPIPLPKTRLP
ncbi:hypothetical protein [Kitasatospora sp. MBT66]|uniref:hypothetical protein n=1 Tax=Kitasatospora sp. MBT66 TaxID=1444769 RepID=UPI0005BCA678|nr:hypothetical protein [Kitasatospora sp. MBT66]